MRDELRFACTCGEDQKARVKEIRDWAEGWMKLRTPIQKGNFLENAVLALGTHWGAAIRSIDGDQWFAVGAENADDPEKWVEPAFRTWIQCDRITDGVAYTLRAFYEHYGEKRTWKE